MLVGLELRALDSHPQPGQRSYPCTPLILTLTVAIVTRELAHPAGC